MHDHAIFQLQRNVLSAKVFVNWHDCAVRIDDVPTNGTILCSDHDERQRQPLPSIPIRSIVAYHMVAMTIKIDPNVQYFRHVATPEFEISAIFRFLILRFNQMQRNLFWFFFWEKSDTNTDLAYTFNLLLCKSKCGKILGVVNVTIYRWTTTGVLHIVQWNIHFTIVIVEHYILDLSRRSMVNVCRRLLHI